MSTLFDMQDQMFYAEQHIKSLEDEIEKLQDIIDELKLDVENLEYDKKDLLKKLYQIQEVCECQSYTSTT